jgi:hypothetical protein
MELFFFRCHERAQEFARLPIIKGTHGTDFGLIFAR